MLKGCRSRAFATRPSGGQRGFSGGIHGTRRAHSHTVGILFLIPLQKGQRREMMTGLWIRTWNRFNQLCIQN